jgi:hypothetical protein
MHIVIKHEPSDQPSYVQEASQIVNLGGSVELTFEIRSTSR